MKTVVICQARTASTRLPRKVLLPLVGKPLLVRCVERIQAARKVDAVVVATTTDPSDDVIATMCAANEIPVYRGHPTDLLERHLSAALMMQADVVVKVPSDCPMIDPHIIDDVIAAFTAMREHVDFVSNLHPGTWPGRPKPWRSPPSPPLRRRPVRGQATAWRSRQTTRRDGQA